jgi:uncharacterized protein (DUF849 family)
MVTEENLTGRLLDAAVAERVMGWQRQPDHNYWMSFPAGETFKLHVLIANWKPSTDLESAMQVVEKMRERFTVAILMEFGGENTVEIFRDSDYMKPAESKGALPEAICRAAIAAVDEKEM